jgi:hypothetical protein
VLTTFPVGAATVAHYRFDHRRGDAPLYELTDSSGREHHGLVLGQELCELTSDVPDFPGLNQGALDARGRLDYAIIPHHEDFAPTGAWTIEFFIKPSLFHQDSGGETNIAGRFADYLNTNLSYTILTKQNTDQPTKYGSAWAFHYQPAKGWVVFTISYGSDSGETLLAAKDLRDGNWHHIAVAFGTSIENELRLFVDGHRATSINQHGGNIPIQWGTGPIYVGAWSRQDSAFTVRDRNFDGMLDEIRFSDTALEADAFVVDFTPHLFPPIPVDVYVATEVRFEAETGKLYRIDEIDIAGERGLLGYAVGEGGAKSFYHRGNLAAASLSVRPLGSEEPLAFETFKAVEIRFQSEPGQTHLIVGCDSLNCVEGGKQTFLLGDGAKMSHFERVGSDQQFFRVERY